MNNEIQVEGVNKMARNYDNEMKWTKEKYIEIRGKVDRVEFEELAEQVKQEIGTAAFIKKALLLFKEHPEY